MGVIRSLSIFGIVAALSAFVLACSSSSTGSADTEAVSSFPEPPQESRAEPGTLRTAVLAGGCFWGVEGVFERLNGVSDVISGYSGGSADDAFYALVSAGTTKHAESVRIEYDPSIISYGTLLRMFFHIAHDPTQLNYQGPDHGPQYRSAIFYMDNEQKRVAEEYVRILTEAGQFKDAIVTRIEALTGFYPAEEYHQDFMLLNPTYPYIVYHDLPKVQALESLYPALLVGTKGESARSTEAANTWRGLPVIESTAGIDFPITRSNAEWRRQLGEFAYQVLREAGTERPFTGELNFEHRPGTFHSAATGQPLFRSETKFESGTGWPSFSKPIDQEAVLLVLDRELGMVRIEVVDSSSGGHLGHVFDDGPGPGEFAEGTGLRYCMNSVSMIFVADGDPEPPIVAAYRASISQ
ncbi:MAG: peptide-methionine (S)-S-oxide reductase MsrA [Spirochaetota bacterium]